MLQAVPAYREEADIRLGRESSSDSYSEYIFFFVRVTNEIIIIFNNNDNNSWFTCGFFSQRL